MATPRKKQYPMVEFECSELFDGKLQLPNADHLPFKVQRALTGSKPDLNPLADFIEEYGAEGALEILDSLDLEEFELFQEKWAEAGNIPAPKSAK